MRAFACGITLALLSGAAFGQSETTPTFEIATVRSVLPTGNPFLRGGLMRAGRYELRSATMVDLIRVAYGVEEDSVMGGPNWLEYDRFDLSAKAPPSVSAAKLKLMLQALLADRFQLAVHNDTKPMPAYVLTVGKGQPKLKEADGSGDRGCRGEPGPANQAPGVVPQIVVSCHNMTMEAFAAELHEMAGGYLASPVVDTTGLKGAWDFQIKWTPRGRISTAGADGISIFDAVDKQLGLKLELGKVPMPVVMVDKVNEKPTADPAGAEKILPPAPTEFEVASVKPSTPESKQSRSPFQPGGRLDLQNFSLKFLIQIAWDLNGDELLAGAPKWLDSEHFDIIAKASTASLLHAPAGQPPMDIDTLRLMLRALLMDRFKLAVHFEDRPIAAFNLVALKPKMAKADPANRTRFREAPAMAKDPRDKNPVLGRLVTCQNMTMAQFAQQLQNIAPGYIHSPVVDATGLDGAYDFTLSFSPAGAFQNQGGRGGGERDREAPPPPSGAGGASASATPAVTNSASDPNGALTLAEAIERQLGLKLEKKTRPAPVLVIDHVEQRPVDN